MQEYPPELYFGWRCLCGHSIVLTVENYWLYFRFVSRPKLLQPRSVKMLDRRGKSNWWNLLMKLRSVGWIYQGAVYFSMCLLLFVLFCLFECFHLSAVDDKLMEVIVLESQFLCMSQVQLHGRLFQVGVGVGTWACGHAFMCAYVYVHECVCVCVYVCMDTHVHAHCVYLYKAYCICTHTSVTEKSS